MDERVYELALYYLVFVFSTTLHEAAHAWAAMRGGDPTAYRGGQVTLDPRPHIMREPIGMVVMPLFGLVVAGFPFGFASAPYDPQWAFTHPRRAGLMAAAGPFSNLLLAIIAAVLLSVALRTGLAQPSELISFGHLVEVDPEQRLLYGLSVFLSATVSLNFLLFIFNLFPFPPLDGSAAINLLLGDKLARRHMEFVWRSPWLGLLGLLLAWKFIGYVFWTPYLLFLDVFLP